eukprot:TRINITY_DN38086_c0_g1_i2.p1 TRINITY_DN38086_c0_g1~~TRINITY_DN38086_c0_g1_i2.p1  ORF type:complete len:731 (-),score=181.40 TRINITY_DN38086_c0_g1_i2:66-2258(-)
MPAQLIDVTPARVRFTGAPGASLTRNVLIRNVSVSELEFEVRAPAGPLFRISRGAEHVGRAVKLPPGEALDLQVMFDPKALAADRGSWNVDGRFLAVLVDMCEPVLMELVVAPEHISAEEVAEATQSLRAAFRSSLSKEVHAKAATMRLPAVAASSQPADASSEDRRRANSPRLLEMLDLLPQEMLPQEMRRGPGIPVTEETAALILPAQPEEDRDPLSDLLAEAERDYTQVVGENQLEGEREEQEEPASTAFRGVVPVAALRGRSFQKVPMRNGVIDVRDASSSGDEGDDDGNDSVNGSKVGSPAKQRLRHQGSGYAQRQPPAGHHLLAAPAVDQTLPGFSSGGSAPSAPSRRSPSAGVAAATTVSAAGAQLDAGAAALAAFLGEVPAAAALRGGGRAASNPPLQQLTTTLLPAGGGSYQAAHRSRQDHSGGSEASTPRNGSYERTSYRSQAGLLDPDDDRPPTPTPAGMESCDAMLQPREIVVKQAQPSAFAHGSHLGNTAGGKRNNGGLDSSLQASAAGVGGGGTGGAASMGTGMAARRARSGSDRGRGSPSLLGAGAAMLSSGASLKSSDATRSTMASGPPVPPGGSCPDGYFFMEGLGWCDAYGRTVQAGDLPVGRGAVETTARGVPFKAGSVEEMSLGGLASDRSRGRAQSNPPRPAAAEKVGSLQMRSGAVCPLPRPAQGASASKAALKKSMSGQASTLRPMMAPSKFDPRQAQMNWDSIGGI